MRSLGPLQIEAAFAAAPALSLESRRQSTVAALPLARRAFTGAGSPSAARLVELVLGS